MGVDAIKNIKTHFSLQESGSVSQTKSAVVSENENSISQEADVELTEEIALNGVKQFADQKLQNGNRQLYATFTSSKISFNNPTILIELNNEVQREMLTTIKQDMLDELRIILKNKQTQLEIKVMETVENLKAYKPLDKFKLMAEKNPMLLELKKRFDLDIEY